MFNAADVVWLDFFGAVVTKRRPAVVLSSATYHAARPDVILGLLTSQIAKADDPTDYTLKDWSTCGLRAPSAFRAFLVTVPRSAVFRKVGRLTDGDWHAVRARVRTALELE